MDRRREEGAGIRHACTRAVNRRHVPGAATTVLKTPHNPVARRRLVGDGGIVTRRRSGGVVPPVAKTIALIENVVVRDARGDRVGMDRGGERPIARTA